MIFVFIFYHQVNTLFLHQSLFKKLTPSQINLMKNTKYHFLLLKKIKNTESAQLCVQVADLVRPYGKDIPVDDPVDGHAEQPEMIQVKAFEFFPKNVWPSPFWQSDLQMIGSC